MPDKCCVPNCTSNYPSKGGYVPVFRFPNEEKLRQAWIRKIPRNHWQPSKWAVVCIHHFHEQDVIKVAKYKDSSGEWKERPIDRLKLVTGALPTIFPDLPAYLSTPETKKRRDPEERRARQTEAHAEKEKGFLEKDIIKDFSTFTDNVSGKSQLLKGWFIYYNIYYVILYQCTFETIPQIIVSVKINNDMNCEVCVNQNIVARSELFDILTGNMKLTR